MSSKGNRQKSQLRSKERLNSSHSVYTPDRWQSKMLILLTNIDQKSLEIEFSIAICRPTVSRDFDLCLSIVKSVFDCRLLSVV